MNRKEITLEDIYDDFKLKKPCWFRFFYKLIQRRKG